LISNHEIEQEGALLDRVIGKLAVEKEALAEPKRDGSDRRVERKLPAYPVPKSGKLDLLGDG